jgi:hypothetical protein
MFTAQGHIQEITVVPEAQLEREAQSRPRWPEKPHTLFFSRRWKKARCPSLPASLLLLSLMSLRTVAITSPVSGRADVSFWGILALLNAHGSHGLTQLSESFTAGIYGLLTVLSDYFRRLGFTHDTKTPAERS